MLSIWNDYHVRYKNFALHPIKPIIALVTNFNIVMIDIITGHTLATILTINAESVIFSQDGRYLIQSDDESMIRVWDIEMILFIGECEPKIDIVEVLVDKN